MNRSNLQDSEYKGFQYSIIQYGFEKPNISREFLEGDIGMSDWWCGYVIIPKGHRFYDKGYDDVEIDCHGGLTFSGELHIEKSKNHKKYAIGFDFNHCDDHGGSKEQVIQQCENLIDQLNGVKN